VASRRHEKRDPSDLAILGGDPQFVAPLAVGRPNIGNIDAFLDRVRDVLDRRWLTNDGPYVQEFERRIADLAGTRHCVAMSSGTVALEIASRGLGLTEEVIMPSFTFVATAHALMWQGTRPVFCDIDPETHHIDPGAIEALINYRTTGILAVHLWGRTCDVDALAEIAKRHGLPIMFDACHALGVTHAGRRVGTFGACEVFSFHATKYLNTLEGGAVVTDDADLAEKLRYMRNFGFSGEDHVTHLGTNGKMNEVSAAMGLTLLDERDRIVAVNRSDYEAYVREVDDICGLRVMRYPSDDDDYNYQHVVAMIDENACGLDRDQVVSVLRAENVLARRYFYPGCHRVKPYSAMHEYAGVRLPTTDDVAARVIVLPTGPQLDDEGIAAIGAILRLAAAAAPRIVDALRASESTWSL
jgi:dTDP-4-amino-4,6-dideoxygalactose transaminase